MVKRVMWLLLLCAVIAAPVTEAVETTDALIRHLKSVGPAECLRVYRVRILLSQYERSPYGLINTRHTAVLEAAYGNAPIESQEVQFLTWGGRIGNRLDSSSQSVCLEPNHSYVVGLTEWDEPGYGLIVRDRRLVGYPEGDSIRFPGLGATVDSTGLCRIVLDIVEDGLPD
ncbi:MAG: hypothetical protein V1778_00305 [bacterium]